MRTRPVITTQEVVPRAEALVVAAQQTEAAPVDPWADEPDET